MDPHATLRELAREIAGARIVRGDADVAVRDVRHDSRDVAPGDLFVARRGQKLDGAAFGSQAAERGAVALITDRDVGPALPEIRVDDIDLALALASCAVWRHPGFTLQVV